jgi:hypothetical protein
MLTTIFYISLKVYLIFLGETDFTHPTQDIDYDEPSSQRVTMTASDRVMGRREVDNITYP